MQSRTVVTTPTQKDSLAGSAIVASSAKKASKRRTSPTPLSTRRLKWKTISTLSILSISLLLCAACQPPESDSLTQKQRASAGTAAEEFEGKDAAYFVDRIADLSHWAQYSPNEKAILRSSNQINKATDDIDFTDKEYKKDGSTWRELINEEGPGCITRVWLSENTQGRLQFYFDDEPAPRLDLSVKEFFNEWLNEAAPNLIFSVTETSCGQVSYIPIPFKKRCTVLTNSPKPDFRYQINITKFAEDENIVSFPAKPDRRLNDALKRTTQFFTTIAPARYAREEKQEQKVTLEPNKPLMISNLPGPGAIDYFEIQSPQLSADTANNVDLKMYWDDMEEPSVLCTLRQFFCNHDFEQNWITLLMGYLKENRLAYSQLYMPFAKKAQIILTNNNEAPIELTFRYHVDIDPQRLPEKPLNLFVRSLQRNLYNGLDYPIFDFEGAGNFIGFNLLGYTQSQSQKLFFLEGDEYFFVDGEENPSLSGTGIDNYFNAENRLENTAYFWSQNYGCISKFVNKAEDGTIQSGCNLFRFNLLDSIPFHSSLFMVQEVGCPVQYKDSASDVGNQSIFNWTCYCYGRIANKPVERNEHASYYVVSQKEDDAPTPNSPIMFGPQLNIKLPKGTWWIHYAPIWNVNSIERIKEVIE